MWEKLRVVFTIPELRQKILLTLLFLGIFRVGSQIPMPMINQAALGQVFDKSSNLGQFLAHVTVFSASNLSQATIFGLGIMPYITASIILQLLGTMWKPLEDLRKEGETGRKKINEYTRYLTVFICAIQSWFFVLWLVGSGDAPSQLIDPAFLSGNKLHFGWQLVAVLTMTCGTVFLMWIGEQIDEFGIGNGISLLIMAGILARMPAALNDLIFSRASFTLTGFGQIGVETLIVLVFLFVAVVFGVVFITQGQRRIPTQSAKHVRGRRVYGGSRQYLPLKLNQSGVMPIIFASSLLLIPSFIFGILGSITSTEWAQRFQEWSSIFNKGESFVYNVLYVAMIYFFCYFWTAITFNPKEMSENLKDYGTFIPGYRPGKRTADYLERVMERITYVGAGFLALVAIVPTIVSSQLNVGSQLASFYGGTGLLIAVSVAFDLVQKIDSHLVMRNYTGLLEN